LAVHIIVSVMHGHANVKFNIIISSILNSDRLKCLEFEDV